MIGCLVLRPSWLACSGPAGGLPATMTEAAAASLPLEMTAAAAIRSARRGEAVGWDWLFDRHHRLVLRYAMARLGDRDAAEDVAQEVFVAAVGAIGRLRDESERGIQGWLLGIARFKVADRMRQLSRDRAHPAVTAQAADDAAELAVTRLSVAELRRAIDRLSEEQREVVIRRFVLDQSLEEVAAATRRPVGAVKSMQHRALASLARICAERPR